MARIGIIGTGWGANVQVPAFRHAGLDIVALAGRHAAKTAERARSLGIDHAPARWQDLVARPDVDLVSIVAPPAEHLEMVRVALAAGKHVLCEKPTALNAEEAEAMLAAANRQQNLITLIDHELRFLPAFAEARRRAADEIGPIRLVQSSYTGSSRADEGRPWSWWSDAEQGGGVLGAIGSHHFDTIRFLTGDEITAVQALLHTTVARRPDSDGRPQPVSSDDTALIHVQLDRGAVGCISLAIAASVDEPTTFTLHGERGALRVIGGVRLQVASRGGAWTDLPLDDPYPPPDGLPGGEFGRGTVALGHALRRAIDEGDGSALQPAATFSDGLTQQRLLDAARRSDRDGGGWAVVPA